MNTSAADAAIYKIKIYKTPTMLVCMSLEAKDEEKKNYLRSFPLCCLHKEKVSLSDGKNA